MGTRTARNSLPQPIPSATPQVLFWRRASCMLQGSVLVSSTTCPMVLWLRAVWARSSQRWALGFYIERSAYEGGSAAAGAAFRSTRPCARICPSEDLVTQRARALVDLSSIHFDARAA